MTSPTAFGIPLQEWEPIVRTQRASVIKLLYEQQLPPERVASVLDYPLAHVRSIQIELSLMSCFVSAAPDSAGKEAQYVSFFCLLWGLFRLGHPLLDILAIAHLDMAQFHFLLLEGQRHSASGTPVRESKSVVPEVAPYDVANESLHEIKMEANFSFSGSVPAR